MNNVTWTKQDITNIIDQLAVDRFVKYNDIVFLRLEADSTDEAHDDFYYMVSSSGGGAAIQLNLGPLKECAEAGSALANKLIDGRSMLEPGPVVVMAIDSIFKMDPSVAEYILAHELGHVVNGDTVAGNGNVDSELKADLFAINTIGSTVGMVVYMDFVFKKINDHLTMPVETKARAFASLNQRLDQFKNEGVVA